MIIRIDKPDFKDKIKESIFNSTVAAIKKSVEEKIEPFRAEIEAEGASIIIRQKKDPEKMLFQVIVKDGSESLTEKLTAILS